MVPALYLILLGIKDKSVIFAKCPLDITQHQGSLQGRSPGNVVPRPPTILGPTDRPNSEAEGGINLLLSALRVPPLAFFLGRISPWMFG